MFKLARAVIIGFTLTGLITTTGLVTTGCNIVNQDVVKRVSFAALKGGLYYGLTIAGEKNPEYQPLFESIKLSLNTTFSDANVSADEIVAFISVKIEEGVADDVVSAEIIDAIKFGIVDFLSSGTVEASRDGRAGAYVLEEIVSKM